VDDVSHRRAKSTFNVKLRRIQTTSAKLMTLTPVPRFRSHGRGKSDDSALYERRGAREKIEGEGLLVKEDE
jgi:hypothetical protein